MFVLLKEGLYNVHNIQPTNIYLLFPNSSTDVFEKREKHFLPTNNQEKHLCRKSKGYTQQKKH